MHKRGYKAIPYLVAVIVLILAAVFLIPEKSAHVYKEMLPPLPEIVKTQVNLKAAGDNLIHNSIYEQAYSRGSGSYDFSYAYKNVSDIISSGDISLLNQETVMTPLYEPSTYPRFNSPIELKNEMLKIGFDVFNQANNHTLDKGEKGIISALDEWNNTPEALVTGVYKNEEDYSQIRRKNVNGIEFAFIGMTELTNGLSLPEGSEVVLLRTFEEDKIKARIEKAKTFADVVVVNVHWGVEYSHTPNSAQKKLAQKMADWGADLIVGHHPHVLQPIEWLKATDGRDVLCAYSLGNFISAQSMGPRMVGGVLDVTFSKNNLLKNPRIVSAKLIPIVTHYDRGYKNIRIYPFSEYSKELAQSHGVRAYDETFNYNYIENMLKKVIGEDFLDIDF